MRELGKLLGDFGRGGTVGVEIGARVRRREEKEEGEAKAGGSSAGGGGGGGAVLAVPLKKRPRE